VRHGDGGIAGAGGRDEKAQMFSTSGAKLRLRHVGCTIIEMGTQPTIVHKPTCQFPLTSSGACKRTVGKTGDQCWQHSRGLRQKLRALVGNKVLMFWLTIVGLAIAVPGLYFTFDSWRKSQENLDLNPLHVSLSSGASKKQRIGILNFTAPKEGWLPQWGDTPPNIIYGVTPGMDLGPAREQYRFVLAARIENPTVDQNEDTTIVKSMAYSIKNEYTTLAIPVSQDFLNRVGPARMVYVSLLLVPSTVQPPQIHKLADVEKLGGGILATNAFLYKTVTITIPIVPGKK
jgi:hypothetical protein